MAGNLSRAGQIVEITELTRSTGNFREHPADVLCLAGVITFEINEPAESILAKLQEERVCSEFTKWQPGATPVEHREMLHHKSLMDREDRRDKQARDFQRQLHREQIWVMGFGLIAATILGAVIGALLTR
jgi:hypothetical protein